MPAKNYWKTEIEIVPHRALFHEKTRICLKHFVNNVILFCFTLNLTDVCSEISFSEGPCRARTSQLIAVQMNWLVPVRFSFLPGVLTSSCMVQAFAGVFFRTDFSCLIFCQYRFYHWFNLNVAGLSESSNVFFFIYQCR